MRTKIIIVTLIISICLGVLFVTSSSSKATSDVVDDSPLTLPKEETKINEVIIDIKGAVNKPGVYKVKEDQRVNDVINLAGGLKKDANTNYINLSAKVKDEMVIWIYTKKEIEQLKMEQTSTKYMIESCNCPVVDNTTCLESKTESNSSGLVNINTATIEQLMTLEGIGESKAKSIIEYRNANNGFKKKEDIKNVSGIGEAAYNKIADHITV